MKKKTKNAVIVIAVAIAVSVFLLDGLDINDRVANWFFDQMLTQEEKKRAIRPGSYRAFQQPFQIGCVEANLSGITFNPDTGTLFSITNNPEVIVELSLQGKCLRKIPLDGFTDTEAIAYLGGNEYAIAEERQPTVSILGIGPGTRRIRKKETLRSIAFEIENEPNQGFEGIAYNPINDALYVVTERSPITLFRFDGLADRSQNHFNVKVSRNDEVILGRDIMHDYSGLHFDVTSGNLLCLSHEAKLVAEVSLTGEKYGFMELEKGFAGLDRDILQAEGITMDSHRVIYIVGEPNIFGVFAPESHLNQP